MKPTPEPQLELLRHAGCDELYVETGSGAKRKRPELEKLPQTVWVGDTVVNVKLDRLARLLTDWLSIVKRL